MSSYFPEVFDFVLERFNLELDTQKYTKSLIWKDKWVTVEKISNMENVCEVYGCLSSHLLVHEALMVFPGSGGLVDFSFTMDAVIHQDVTPEHKSKLCHTTLSFSHYVCDYVCLLTCG